MQIHFIIDGYNVIHALPSGIDRGGSLESRREGLINLIKSSSLYARHRFTIVFDGAENIYGQEKMSHENLSVLFSRPPENADRLILKICSRKKDHKNLEVVSSDREHIIGRVNSMGIRTTTSQAFIQRLLRRKKTAPPFPDEKPEPSPDDVSYWNDIFEKS